MPSTTMRHLRHLSIMIIVYSRWHVCTTLTV
jgi:hypothetical protein